MGNSNSGNGEMGYIIFLLVVVLIASLIWLIVTRNRLIAANIKCDEAFSGIDTSLERRYDAVKQCFAAAKNYVSHEQETILSAVRYRAGMSAGELAELDEGISKSISTFNAVAESHPDLKASELYANLQKTVSETEEILQASRRIFNSNVTIFNKIVQLFPTSIAASIFGFKSREFFAVSKGKTDVFEIPLE